MFFRQNRAIGIQRTTAENRLLYHSLQDHYHHSEYVGDYFKFREYITGFTGSAGTAIFTKDKAGLLQIGRYFIQAEAQLKGSGITLYKSGESDVPTIEEFLKSELKKGDILGFDGRTVTYAQGKRYCHIADKRWRIIEIPLRFLHRISGSERPEMSYGTCIFSGR